MQLRCCVECSSSVQLRCWEDSTSLRSLHFGFHKEVRTESGPGGCSHFSKMTLVPPVPLLSVCNVGLPAPAWGSTPAHSVAAQGEPPVQIQGEWAVGCLEGRIEN